MISIMGNFEVCLQHYLFILNAESECLRGDNLWNLGSSGDGSSVNESSGWECLECKDLPECRQRDATSLQFLVTQTQPTPAAAEKYTHRQYLRKYIWQNLRNTVLESEKYSLQKQEVHPQDTLLLS